MTQQTPQPEPASEAGGSAAARGGRWRRWGLRFGAVVIAAVLISTLIRVLFWDVYTVNQESMQPTLEDADRILVDKRYPGDEQPERGDIVVFDGEGSFTPYRGQLDLITRGTEQVGHWFGISSPSQYFVKRVIGSGGDVVVCCDEQGRLQVNGESVNEPYLAQQVSAEQPASELEFEAEVPPGRIWVMGDNRAESVDSRDLLGAPGGGMISQDRIVGQPVRVVWPPGGSGSIEEAGR